jgi:hypothetical protein
MKTANDILKELHECENPVTSSSLKTIAITKLKAERDKYRKALEDISKLSTGDYLVLGHYLGQGYDEIVVNEIINEAL